MIVYLNNDPSTNQATHARQRNSYNRVKNIVWFPFFIALRWPDNDSSKGQVIQTNQEHWQKWIIALSTNLYVGNSAIVALQK